MHAPDPAGPIPCRRAQISLEPLGHWPLCATLQAAAGAALAAAGWQLLREGVAVEADLLGAPPGHQGTAALVEFEVAAQQPATLLLSVPRAGRL
jgi:hypothetical protein